MPFEFGRIKRLPPYVFSVITNMKNEARRRGEDIIDFGMGNPDQATPRHIVDKLIASAQMPKNHRYSASRGITKLREAVCDRYRNRYGVDLDPGTEAVVTIGSKEGLSHLALATIEPGDVVLTTAPAYPIHPYSVIIAGGEVRSIPLRKDGDFLADLQEAYKNTWPCPKMLIINFPNDPTTQVVDLAFFQRIADFAKETGILVVHDLAYADLNFDGYKAPSFLQAKGAKDAGVEFFSLTKSCNMAGWRRGLLRGEPGRCGRARQDQELPGLRHVPADPDRVHHRAQRPAEVPEGDIGHVPVPARRARGRTEPRGLAHREAKGHHVRLGRDPGALSEDGVARVLHAARTGCQGGRLRGHRVR
jgi:aspartate/methionine/tyrosine aminotransferase